MLLVDGGGEPLQANLYGAFGEVRRAWGDSRNDRHGNTKEHDRATGLANHGFRYYDPATGRYLSEDPLGYAGGFNLHVHCGNDPVNKFDPLGLFGWWEFTKAFAGEVGNGVVDAGKAAVHAVSHPVQTATAIKDRAVQRYGAIYERESAMQKGALAKLKGALVTANVALGDALGYTKIAEGAYGIDIETGQPLNGTERFQKISGGMGQVAGAIAGGAAVAGNAKNYIVAAHNAKHEANVVAAIREAKIQAYKTGASELEIKEIAGLTRLSMSDGYWFGVKEEFISRSRKIGGLSKKSAKEAYEAFKAGDFEKMAGYYSFDTEGKIPMFWSKDKAGAMKVANERGGIIMEQTKGGKVFDGAGKVQSLLEKKGWLEEKVGRAGGEAFWKSISKRYAGSIPQNSKPVYVIPEGAKPGNIWSNTEKEILRKRGFDANYI